MSESSKASASRDFATHRRARHEYVLLEKMEAGIELLGAEVKAIRDGQASLAESFGDVEGGQLFLRDLTIQPYRFARAFTADPSRSRRLLMHGREIARLQGLIAAGGVTLIPLRLYARKGRIKVELALCRGKQHADKREAIRSRTAAREADREIASRGRK
jgi:SsrA-binding protein